MEGIAYPVANPTSTNCLCMWYGGADKAVFDPLLKHVNFSYLGLPNSPNLVNVVGVNNRNSDESSFASRGFPTMRWAGMRTAGNYPAYHAQDDTIARIIEVAGGESYVQQGLQNTSHSAYYSTLAVDNKLPVPLATAVVSGRTVAFDGSASSDADGPLTGFSWDFGDGTTGTGAAATHTYAAAGTYTARLTVQDNLWPAVTKSATVSVTAS
jgi:hypothetical protein